MALYNPPLRLSRKEDWNTTHEINNALEGFEIEYFYTGNRLGKELIELEVSTVIKDSEDNLFLRSCKYTGSKEKWKEVIQEQLKNQLRDLGVDEGFVKAETRYFVVSNENHLIAEKFENRKKEYIHKVTSKESE